MKHWFLLLIVACSPDSPRETEAAIIPESAEAKPELQETTEPLSSPSKGSLHPLHLPEKNVAQLQHSGPPVIRLLDHVQDGSFDLPNSNLDPSWTRHYSLTGPWMPARPGTGWKTQLPKELRQDNKKGVPRTLQLLRMSQPLDYLQTGQNPKSGQKCWQIRNGWVHIFGFDNPAGWTEPPVMERSSQALAMDRYNFGTSNLAPTDFVKLSIALGNVTRESLLLPAPSHAVFRVQVPEDAKLRWGLGIAQIPGLPTEAKAKVTLQINQEAVWNQEIHSNDEWLNTNISLEKWSGQEVTLEWISDSLGDPYGDWLVIAEPEIIGAPSKEGPRRVIILGFDTLRPDYLGLHGMQPSPSPFLDQLATQSIVFESAWAPAPRTRPSFRTALTGHWPIAARSAPTIGALFSQAGFTTAGIVANVHLSPGMGFSDGYGYWRYAHSGDAEDQVDHALAWVREHQDEDSFLFLHFMDPHIFYRAPEPWTDHFANGVRPNQLPDLFNRPIVNKLDKQGQLTSTSKDYIRARYMGEIGYLDSQLSRLVSEIDALSGQTMWVLISDHGEEFWEHQGFEHNHSLYSELTQVMFWIRPPLGHIENGPFWVPNDVSLADIVPTLNDVIGATNSVMDADGTSLYPFLDSTGDRRDQLLAELDSRPIPMGHLMQDKERWGVIFKQHKYILHRASGEEEFFDLLADPHEQHNLASERSDISEWYTALQSATGYPTGPGWHVHFTLKAPITLKFENPIEAIEIIDPEADRPRRANQEWGERPPLRPADVATVLLSADKQTVQVTPQISGNGTLAILGDPGAIRVVGPANPGLQTTLQSGVEWKPTKNIRLLGTPRVVIIAGETENMLPTVTANSEESAALKSLGYLE